MGTIQRGKRFVSGASGKVFLTRRTGYGEALRPGQLLYTEALPAYLTRQNEALPSAGLVFNFNTGDKSRQDEALR